MLENELCWKAHIAYATAKGSSYTIMLWRLSTTSWSITAQLIHQLYQSVTVPKITYTVAVWLLPSYSHLSDKRLWGSKGTAKKANSMQRATTLAITGAMRTSPTDFLNVLTNLLVHAHLMLWQILFCLVLHLSGLLSAYPPHQENRKERSEKTSPCSTQTSPHTRRPPSTHRNHLITSCQTRHNSSIPHLHFSQQKRISWGLHTVMDFREVSHSMIADSQVVFCTSKLTGYLHQSSLCHNDSGHMHWFVITTVISKE